MVLRRRSLKVFKCESLVGPQIWFVTEVVGYKVVCLTYIHTYIDVALYHSWPLYKIRSEC
jgi:hypothetical protein